MRIGEWNFPDDLVYDEHHQWLRQEGLAITVGLTDYGQHTRGDIIYLSLPEPGLTVKAGEAAGSLETGKWVGRFYAPAAGIISAVNEEVLQDSRLINSDPYGRGWLFKIKLQSGPGPEYQGMNVFQLKEWLNGELERDKAMETEDED